MYLQRLTLLNFKNYPETTLTFSPGVNALVGPNGSGKTNMLDAVHYLALTKSALNAVDGQNILHGEDFFTVKGLFRYERKQWEVLVNVPPQDKKVVKCNGTAYTKISDHIGTIPLVLLTPYDTDLIREGSELRRRYFDGLISQLDRPYLEYLMQYNHALRQRNSLLKQFGERHYFDADLLTPYSERLIALAAPIHAARQELMAAIQPHFQQFYRELSGEQEEVSLEYKSQAGHEHFARAFREGLAKDRALQRTTQGIHKDDFVFEMGGRPLKKFASQGQQKSFVIALKLAQFHLFKERLGFTPLLLMDDIFDKLDDARIQRLMNLVSGEGFGQLLVTDARPERTQAIFEAQQLPCQVVNIEQGAVKTVDLIADETPTTDEE